MNTVLLQGNLTRDPEMKYTPKGDAVCSFSIAINEEYETKQGEKKATVTFVDCKTWRGMAEKVAAYKKGTALYVFGKLRTDSWDDKQSGQKRYKTYVLADAVTSPYGAGKPKAEAAPAAPTQPELPEDSDSIPF